MPAFGYDYSRMEDEGDRRNEVIPIPDPVPYMKPPPIDFNDKYNDSIPPMIPDVEDSSEFESDNKEEEYYIRYTRLDRRAPT